MKKLIVDELPYRSKKDTMGKPPNGLSMSRKPLTASDVDADMHATMTKAGVFKETTPEDYQRILAQLKNELGKV